MRSNLIRRAAPASTVALAATVAIAVSACGGGSSGNGITSKSPKQIVTAMTKALNGVKSVHVGGSVNSGGQVVTLDLTLTSGNGAEGTIAENALSFKMIATGGNIYIYGGKAFLSRFGGKAGAQLFAGKWIEAPASGQFAQLGSFTDLHALFGQLLTTHGTLVKDSTKTIDGQKVLGLRDTSKQGILYVATTGQPYPIEIVKAGAQGGEIKFTHYNAHVAIRAPHGAINLSQLGAGSSG